MKRLSTILFALVVVVVGGNYPETPADAEIRTPNGLEVAADETKTRLFFEEVVAGETSTPLTFLELAAQKKQTLLEQAAIEQTRRAQNTLDMRKTLKALRKTAGRTWYVFSGVTPQGWDCSGLVRWQYKTAFGITLPHSANKLGHLGKRVSKPNVGDIVVMARAGSSEFYHAGVYVGAKKVLNANRHYGTTVIEPLSNYKKDQIRFIRIVKVRT
jgi:cell wall-associated NlpC family hydrolase